MAISKGVSLGVNGGKNAFIHNLQTGVHGAVGKFLYNVSFKPIGQGSTISKYMDLLQGNNTVRLIPFGGNTMTFVTSASLKSQIAGEAYSHGGDMLLSLVFSKPQEISWNGNEISRRK